MNFFETIHCTSRSHCKTCRSKHKGRSIREGWARQWPMDADFDCPQGYKWEEAPARKPAIFIDTNGNRFEFSIEDQFADVCKEAECGDFFGDLWDTLRVQIRGVKMVLEQHQDNSPCWKRKQMQRVIQMWQKIKRNGSNAGIVVKYENVVAPIKEVVIQ